MTKTILQFDEKYSDVFQLEEILAKLLMFDASMNTDNTRVVVLPKSNEVDYAM